MSEYFGDYPAGREVTAEPSEYGYYERFPTATPRFVEFCERNFERRDPSELDFSSHRKVRDTARGGYYRYYGMAEIEGAPDAGVTAFCEVGGRLLLLETPGAEKVETEHWGTMEGREARPSEPLGTLTSWGVQDGRATVSRRRKYLNPRDWEAVAEAEGVRAAGLPPPGAWILGKTSSPVVSCTR